MSLLAVFTGRQTAAGTRQGRYETPRMKLQEPRACKQTRISVPHLR